MAIWNREHWIDGRWAMANGRLGASPKDNMCDSWRWLPRMITEITISGPRNKKKCAATAASERVNKWQPKLWRYCQNKCEAIYEIFMKCDMADNKYIYIWAKIPTRPPHSQVLQIWSKQTPTGADKWRKPRTNPDIFVSLNKNANKTCGRHNLAHWLMAMFRLPFCHCVICQMRRESRGSRVRKPWMRGTEDIPTKTGTAVCPTDQVFVAVLLFAAQLNGKRLTLSGSISLPLYSQQSYQSHLASQSVRGSHSKSGTSELRSCHSLKLYSHDRGTGHVI